MRRLAAALFVLPLLAACQTTASPDAGDGSEPVVKSAAFAPAAAPMRLVELRGLTPARIEDAFGAPEFTRHEQQVRIWRYRLESCVVELFFYPRADGALAVRHAEARGAQGGAIDGDACVAHLGQSARS